MNPTTAMRDPVFLAYLMIIGGVLGSVGIVLALFTWVLKKDVSKVWVIYRSWWIIGPLGLWAILLGRIPTIVLFTTVSLLAMKEFAGTTGLYRDKWTTGTVYAGIIALGIAAGMRQPTTGEPGWYGLFMTLPVYVVGAILMVPIFCNHVKGHLQGMALAVLGFVCLGWMLLHVVFLAHGPDTYGYLLYLIVAVELSEVAALSCGKMFGKRPFRGNIAPRKTWGGAIGAFVVSMGLPWLLWFSFPHFDWRHLVLTGLIVGIGGQMGDLVISVIKRDIGMKDMGAALSGHGGVLDRVNSLIFVAPPFLHMVDYFFWHW